MSKTALVTGASSGIGSCSPKTFPGRARLGESRRFQGQSADAGRVALAGYRGLMAGKRLVIPGMRNKLIPLVARLSPRGLMARVVRQAQQRVPR